MAYCLFSHEEKRQPLVFLIFLIFVSSSSIILTSGHPFARLFVVSLFPEEGFMWLSFFHFLCIIYVLLFLLVVEDELDGEQMDKLGIDLKKSKSNSADKAFTSEDISKKLLFI